MAAPFTDEDLEIFRQLPDEERRKAMQDSWVADGVAGAMNNDAMFSQLPMQEKIDAFLDMGLPFSKLPTPQADPIAPQMPNANAPPVPTTTPGQPGIFRQIAETDISPTGAITSLFNKVLPAGLQGMQPYEVADTEADTWYYKTIRGLVGAGPTGIAVRPPGTQADILSIENAAKVAGMILWTAGSKNPFQGGGKVAGGISAAATAFGQEGIKTAGRMAAKVLPETGIFGMQQGPIALAGWLMTQPGLARAINSAAYSMGRFGMLDVTRDIMSNHIRTGKISKEEASQALGPALYRELVLGVPVNLALQGAGVARHFITAMRGMGPTMVKAVSEGMGTAPLDAAKVLDDVLWPMKTLVKTSGKDAAGQHIELSALAPEQMIRNETTTLRSAIPGDWVRFKGGNDATQVVRKIDGGAVVRDTIGPAKLGPERTIKYNDKSVGEIISPRGPMMKGMEVFDTTAAPSASSAVKETFIFDRYLPNGKAYVIAPDGRVLLKDPAKLTTDVDSYTYREYSTNMKNGQPLPPPEGRMTYQDYKVTKFDADGTVHFEKPYGEIGDTIPYKAITNPLPDHPDKADFKSFWYALEPTTVLTMMNKPETTQLAKEVMDGLLKNRTLINEFHKTANAWQDAVGRSNKPAAERLTRAFAGVPHPDDAALMTPAEKTVLAESTKFAQKYLYPHFNEARMLAGEPEIPTNYPIPYVLFPELLLGSGSRYTTTGQAIHEIAGTLAPVGTDNLVRVSTTGAGMDYITKLDIHSNFWGWLNVAMRYAADKESFKGLSQKAGDLGKYYAKNPENANAGKYLEWFGEALNGRTNSAYLADVFNHNTTLNRWQEWLMKHPGIPKIGGKTSDASLGDWNITTPKYELRSVDLYEAARVLKTISYAATIGLSVNTGRLNMTQMLTHTLPQMPGKSAEEMGRNVGLIAAGAVRGAGYAGLTLLQTVARDNKWLSKHLSSKNLDFYRQNGVLSDFEEVFSPATVGAAGTTFSKLKGVTSGALFGIMRGTEIINRIGSYDAVKNAVSDDIRRRGVLLAMQEPDVEAAIHNLSKSITSVSQFIYGKGARSMIQERGWPITEKSGNYIPEGIARLIGPASEIMHQYNTFAYKTMSTYTAEWQQFKKGNPNFIRQIAAVDSPEEFVRYLKELDSEGRNQFWRTIAIRGTVGALLATTFGLNNLFIQAFGVDPGVPHVPTALWNTGVAMKETVRRRGLAGVPMAPFAGALQLGKEFFPAGTAGSRFLRGKDWEESFFVSNRPGRDKDFDDWIIEGFIPSGQRERR